MPYPPCIGIVLLRLDLCANCVSNRAIIPRDIRYELNWGYRNCCHECNLGIYLVIDTFCMYLVMLDPCIQMLSNQTIDYGDIAFKRFRGYSKCMQFFECSECVKVKYHFKCNFKVFRHGHTHTHTQSQSEYNSFSSA